MMIRYVLPDQYTQIAVSANAVQVAEVNAFMTAQWNTLFPTRLYNGHMLALDKQEMVEVNVNIMYMYVFLGAIAMMLSVTGLFTLVSLNIIKRMKEIGVRKVLGASVGNVARIINTEFVIILAISSALGSWASYSLNNALMSSIWKYYQGVNVLTFAVAIGLMFLISFLTIGFKIMSVATMNPVKSLQDE
jgi:ABC-type antimicrobial peptide transport system permease subunit